MLTIKDITTKLRVTRFTVYKLINDGVLKAYKIGRQYRVDQADFEAFMKSQREGSQSNENN
jgi:putative molybdopterin biosynthesis protein